MIRFAGMPLDRAGNNRENTDWLNAANIDTAALYVPVWNDQVLFDTADELLLRILRADHPAVLAHKTADTVFLGVQGDAPVFVLNLSLLSEAELNETFSGETERFSDLRSVMMDMRQEDAALASYAKGMIHWHRHHRYCGACGAETVFANAGHMRKCSNETCGYQAFPRTDPVVIMSVERQDKDGNHYSLLGRSGRFPQGRFSTLAGFVDPGETLEEAVAREVFEEAGIRVENIQYVASQPWPFPASLMIGFRATAITDEIVIDDKEIAEARWFSLVEVQSAGDWDSEMSTGLQLPGAGSIARHLINSWVKDCAS